MLRTMMKSKIHRATVTQADVHYVGSVTVDEDLLDAADLLPGELVHIVDGHNRVVGTGDDPAEVAPGMASAAALVRGEMSAPSTDARLA
jgi:hypothetical protein